MAIDRFQIRAALRARLQGAAGYPGDDKVHWENKQFPIKGQDYPPLWLRESFMPSDERASFSGRHTFEGIWQISIFVAQGSGTKQADDLAQAIVNRFRPGTPQIGSPAVSIDRAESLSGPPEDEWWHVPVRIWWRVTRNP